VAQYLRIVVLEQFYLRCLAHASYLVGDSSTRTAIIVDPQRDIDLYVKRAAELGLEIHGVFLTHFHADFLAGHLELRDRGATIYLGAKARAEYKFVPMADGDVLPMGRVRLQILETPGHTIESISILVFDLDRDAEHPYAVLTGDALFVGDVGRPDLRAASGWAPPVLARMLYHSLHDKLLTLPDATLIYPAHGAGSLCGRNLSPERVSTLGDQRRLNYALRTMDEDAFVRLVTVDQPDAPDYFEYDAVLNTREHPTLDAALKRELKPLTPEAVLALQNAGVQVLDTREPSEFAQAHMRDSINIGLGGHFATWAGTVLDRKRPIVIIAEPTREVEAAKRLGRIGFDVVVGYLDDGIHALEDRDDLIQQTRRVSAEEAAAFLADSKPPLVLDVRTPTEWETTRIDPSVNIPLNHLTERAKDVPRDRDILVLCEGGYRSSIAASLLQQRNFTALVELAGGMAAWEAAGMPVGSSPHT
jgi:rhodanese-related sulfurtransferase/glyoxylase-like metal-dependent hydrolase (beta-lactamase superfamily II)